MTLKVTKEGGLRVEDVIARRHGTDNGRLGRDYCGIYQQTNEEENGVDIEKLMEVGSHEMHAGTYAYFLCCILSQLRSRSETAAAKQLHYAEYLLLEIRGA